MPTIIPWGQHHRVERDYALYKSCTTMDDTSHLRGMFRRTPRQLYNVIATMEFTSHLRGKLAVLSGDRGSVLGVSHNLGKADCGLDLSSVGIICSQSFHVEGGC